MVINKTIDMKTELVKHFVMECKQEQEWKKRFKANHIEFDNYFKYSGQVERERQIYMNTNLWNYENKTEREAAKISCELVGQE